MEQKVVPEHRPIAGMGNDEVLQRMADSQGHLPLEEPKILANGAPDRLSVEPSNPYFNLDAIKQVAVRFNGVEQTKVVEYCVSEGWIRRHSQRGKLRLSRAGKALAFRSVGDVEVRMGGGPWAGKD
jgi:hypothetical protein